MNTIPFVDLRAQHRSLEPDLSNAIAEVTRNCDFILGQAVEEFEAEFAAFLGARHAVGVGTGLDALHWTLRAAGVRAGDEVIIPADTFIATALAISASGAKPALVDVSAATFNIDPSRIEAALTPRTKALMPVHLFGQPCEMDAILDIARKHSLLVIEDACQSHGARYKGKAAGTLGLAGCFSFYPGKNLGACGDGGMIVTNDDDLAAKTRMLRNYGQKQKYQHLEQGTNSRLDTVQAAILRLKLKHLDQWNRQRAQHAKQYSERLAHLPQVQVPAIGKDRTHVFHLYVIRVLRRAALQEFLGQRGIQTIIHYPMPVHLHEAYAELGYRRGDFPVSEQLADEILSLPMFAELTENQIDYVCGAIREFYRS